MPTSPVAVIAPGWLSVVEFGDAGSVRRLRVRIVAPGPTGVLGGTYNDSRCK